MPASFHISSSEICDKPWDTEFVKPMRPEATISIARSCACTPSLTPFLMSFIREFPLHAGQVNM